MVENTTNNNAAREAGHFQVRFNRSVFPADTLEEAKKLAMSLIDPACPFVAKVVEVDAGGEFIRTVTSYGPANA